MSKKAKQTNPRDTMFVEGIPADVRANFKAACAKKQETMKDVLIKFMMTYAGTAR